MAWRGEGRERGWREAGGGGRGGCEPSRKWLRRSGRRGGAWAGSGRPPPAAADSALFLTMGDMKTPDFDDLLAAFDIPDIDTNEAIHSGHEEADAHIKQVPGEPGPPDHVLPHTDITAVSVIVKNTVCPEQLDALDGRSKDGHVIGSRLLQNGFGATEMPRSPTSRSVEAVASSNGECWVKEKGPKPLDIFSHFSPDPNEDNAANLIDRPRECKAKEKSLAVPSLSPSPTLSLDCKEPMGENTENLPPAFPQSFETGQAGGASGAAISCIKKEESDSEEVGREASPKGLAAALGDSPLEHLKSVTVRYSTDDSPITSWPGSDPNLDSSTSNLAEVKHSPASPREPFFKPSSPVVQSPRLPPSPKHLDSIALKEEHEVLDKSMGSPQSMSSAEEEEEEEDNTNDSPSSNSSRPLKVRIKTIKTSCGSITRTVTRVSSDSEPGSTKGPPEQSSQETSLEGASFSASADKEEGIVLEVSKDKMELSSPLKSTEGPKIVSVQLGNGTKLKGTVLPVSTIQNASSAMLIAASVAQQKSMVLPAKAGKAVAKNIINLVPQTLPKADTRTNVSTVTQTSTITTTANQKVNGTTVVMVQPQKPSPTLAGTVISRSQSSLVEAFNKILNSKNLLPTYKPNLNPPADASLALPPFGYRCLECGDAFALEKSLARHYDRRSMRIEVTCNHCTKRLVFFNKCSLLLHAREHKDKGLVMQCSHLVMRPIALDQMIGQPDITPLVSVTSFPASKVTGVAQDALATANGAQDLPILPLSNSSEQTNYSCFRCLECKEQCKDKAGLAAHFQQAVSTGTSSSMVCTTCPMIMSNRCSFSAHQRIHKNRPPHVCPECGGNFLLANFEAHLKDACLHFSRRVGYRCPSCAVVFGGVNSIKSHIQTSHCEVFHKCPICPMAFKSAPSAHAHVYTQHPGFGNQQSKMIYKCAMCDTVFTHKPLLSSHFDQHLLNQRVSVFKCPDCPLLFAQKRTMLEHLKNTHQPQKPKEDLAKKAAILLTPKQEPLETPVSKVSESSSSSTEEDEPPSSPELRKTKRSRFQRKTVNKSKGSGWTCGVCHSWFPERDEYVSHMKKDHGKSVKKFPCHLCERSFCSAPSLRRHVRVNHEGIKRVYPCRYCTEGKRTFSSRLILEKHIQVRHGIKVTDQTKSQEVVIARIGTGTMQASGRKRKLSSDEGDSCSEEPDSTTPPSKTSKGDRKAPLRCRKCGYLASSAADFQEHIPQHRTDESSHQCRECGLCFTSQVSLNRHRFITHKKKKGAGELEEPGPRSPLEGGAPHAGDGKLSCKVCGRCFDSQLNLKTHFRTHGMAFIRARQNVSPEN